MERGVFGSIVLSAISSVVVAAEFWGAQPMFRIPSIRLVGSEELLAYAALGISGGCFPHSSSDRLSAAAPASALDPVPSAGRSQGSSGYYRHLALLR